MIDISRVVDLSFGVYKGMMVFVTLERKVYFF